MRVQVKLMASLRSKLPPGSQGGATSLQLEPGATISAALEQVGVTQGQIHLVLVNGAMELDRSRALHEDDELVVFPPVAGGAALATGKSAKIRQFRVHPRDVPDTISRQQPFGGHEVRT